ncbi:MAG: ABC transporter substrate-binding protein [Cetobacterium sp.]|uniref:ABC transporter substrate-binding protein n=1 Tax=Cetobacterium sp. TaxID=2071632 RepID=UPI002FCC8D89
MKKFILIFFIGIFLKSFLYGDTLISKKYNKIISLSMAGDEMLFDLVDKERILALSGKTNNNEMGTILWDKLDNFNKIEDDLEKVIDLEPDLVIVADWMKKDIISQLEDANIKIYIYETPFSYEKQKEVMKKLAKVVEEEERATEIIKNMDERLKEIYKKIKDSKKSPPRVLEYSHYEGTNGLGSMFDSIIQKSGGINLATQIGIGRFSKISKEKVIEIDPDIILVPIWDSTATKDSSNFLEFLKNDKGFSELKAVKNNAIYSIPGKYIYVYSQYVIDGIEEVAESIYQFEN